MRTKSNTHPQTIYNFIAAYWQENGYAPSLKEIAEHIGRSRDVTRDYLVELRALGAIDWIPKRERTIRIVGEFRNIRGETSYS